jgi:hypothetical protein
MACSTDFKKVYELYQLEGVPKGISIVHFCQMNGIVYKHYERWYKNNRSAKIIPVELVGVDDLSDGLSSEALPVSDSSIGSLDIHFSNGLHLHHEQIDYRTLRILVEKLEVLC